MLALVNSPTSETSMASRPDREDRSSRSYRILVVDDNRQIHDDFRKILCAPRSKPLISLEEAMFGEQPEPRRHEPPELQFVLETALQGQEALALLERGMAEGQRCAMAFVDVRMPPGWDGIETTERLWRVDFEAERRAFRWWSLRGAPDAAAGRRGAWRFWEM